MRDILGLVLFTIAVKIMRPQTLRAVLTKIDEKATDGDLSDEQIAGGYAALYAREAADADRGPTRSAHYLADTTGDIHVSYAIPTVDNPKEAAQVIARQFALGDVAKDLQP